ncbi:cupin-like domain-containing protein [Phaeosphaeria sp. MPI-PUGE-AT-0046c]|nr:cupin-like domain-containing protein [Phaeosphaeria sp. MPI-PUGE-AT-0046c]
MSDFTVVGLKDEEQAKTRPVPTELPKGATVHDAIKGLLENYHDINSASVTELTQEPTPLEFMRFVARNQPFIIRNKPGPQFQKTLKLWNAEYLCQKMSDHPVTVACTPNGKADAVHSLRSGGLLFIKPHEILEPFSSAVQQIRQQQEQGPSYTGPTRYIQSQNDNLRSEYSSIFSDVPASIHWASAALDQDPDAVNFWLGNEHSTSALHKDHYENIFMQVRGSKEFILLPPVESPCVNERAVLSATFAPSVSSVDSTSASGTDTSSLSTLPLCIQIDEPESYVPLPTWDPETPTKNSTEYTLYARPLRVRVDPGDVLYLPALWYHKVKQITGDEGICCSVNYWYDMDFAGPFQCSARFVQEVAGLGKPGEED